MSRGTMVVCMMLALLGAPSAHAELTPATLRCEYLVNPVGLDVTQPRLSWTVTAKRRGERQTAYQIRVAGSAAALKAGRGDLWDTGKVGSSETVHIPYAGRALTSGQECWWQVRVWDRDGRPSAFSAPARWTMGLLRPDDWKARWIGMKAPAPAPPPAATPARATGLEGLSWVWAAEGGGADPAASVPAGRRYFRRRVDLPADRTVRSARFLLTADDQFTLYVNGREAGRSDGQPDAWRRPSRLDIRQHLRAGANLLAVAVENTSASPAGLAGRLRIAFETGDPLIVPIDRAWKATRVPAAGWETAAFDDGAWSGAVEVARVGEGPWGELTAEGARRQLVLPPSPFLRKEFRIEKPVRRAHLYVTALGLYEMRLDGRRVGEDLFRPGWTDYRKRVYYQTYDVTDRLRPGSHALGAILADGWACGYVGLGGRDRYGVGRPRLLAQLNITYADGATDTVATDGSWKAAHGPILEADLLMGERYDARQERVGWDRPGFGDAEWQAAAVHDPWPARIEAGPLVPVRRMLELRARTVTEPQPGVFVFDLGQNMVGWARLAVRGPAGTQVRLRFAEVLNPDGTLYTTNLRGARCTDTYILRGGAREVWEPRFTFHGFRYVEVTGYPGRPSLDAVTGVVTHSVMPKTGSFVTSSEMVNRLQQNIEWGQRGNFLEVPTDCPQRDERLGWTGDALAFARTAAGNMDVAAFLTKWMVDVEDAQRPNGAFTDVAPFVAAGAGTAAWGDAGVVVPWVLYQVYGDRQIIRRHYDAMARWIAYLEQNSNGLLRPARGYGDWVAAGPPTPTDVIGTAMFAHSTALLAKMARVIGKEEDARKYEALFGRIRDAFNQAYVAEDGRIKGNTQTSYLLALNIDLLPPEKRSAALRHLVQDLEDRGWHLATGFVGTVHLMPVLTRYGRTDVAYRLLNQETYPSWLYTIRNGATTIWERWDGIRPDPNSGGTRGAGFQDPGMNSFNHYAFGCVGEWLYDTVAGIDTDPARPGFRHAIIRPRPGGGLTWVRAEYRSIRGAFASHWKQEGGRFTLDVSVPANTTATIHVPAPSVAAVTEGGRPARTAPGLRFVRMEDGAAVFEAGSGEYRFVVARAREAARARMPKIEHDHANVNGVRLHYAKAGKGKLILFLHGFPEFWYAWKEQLAEFGLDHLAVAVDMRGYNLSAKPAEVEQYQIPHLVEDVRALAAHLGQKKLILVGHDWGGVVAWLFALTHPGMVEKLVIINAPHPAIFQRELAENPEQQKASQYMLLFRSSEAEKLLSADNYAMLVNEVLGEGLKHGYITEADRKAYVEAWSQPGALTGGLNYYRAARVGPPAAGEKPAPLTRDPPSLTVNVPTLVIWGERDTALLPGNLNGLEQLVPDLKIRRIPDGSHWVVHEKPALVNAAIREFIAAKR